MLETEIQKLTVAIERLTATLEGQGALALTAKKPAPVKVETKPEPKVSEPKHSAGEVQAKCLEIVKADRSKKQAIADLIAKHTDGKGKLVKDVPPSQLDALAADLEAL
jgi:hypothetical protein